MLRFFVPFVFVAGLAMVPVQAAEMVLVRMAYMADLR